MPKFLVYLRSREVRSAIIEAEDREMIEDWDIPDATFHRDVFFESYAEVQRQVADDVPADLTLSEE